MGRDPKREQWVGDAVTCRDGCDVASAQGSRTLLLGTSALEGLRSQSPTCYTCYSAASGMCQALKRDTRPLLC